MGPASLVPMAQCRAARPPPRAASRERALCRCGSACTHFAPSARYRTTPSALSISPGPSSQAPSARARGREGQIQEGSTVVRIPELYARAEPTISFELFPPKTDAAEAVLFNETLPALRRLGPSFISVTYGAGGSTRARTLAIAARVR